MASNHVKDPYCTASCLTILCMVPVVLRSALVRSFQHPPLSDFGVDLYDKSARYCARRFSRLPGVGDVHLRASAVDRCRPAFSDLDWVWISSDKRPPEPRPL